MADGAPRLRRTPAGIYEPIGTLPPRAGRDDRLRAIVMLMLAACSSTVRATAGLAAGVLLGVG